MKFKTVFVCQKCGYESPKWAGKCPECGEWNTLVEEVKQQESKRPSQRTRSFTDFSSEIVKLSESKAVKEPRIETHIFEFDRLLGGGLVKGQLTLLAGAPGIGKSTLMLQVAAELSKTLKVLYISGEESIGQISGRAQRLNVKGENIFLHCETDIQKIVESVEQVNPDVLIWLIAAVACAGLTGSARLWLGRHTLGQVLSGYAVGFCSVYFLTMI